MESADGVLHGFLSLPTLFRGNPTRQICLVGGTFKQGAKCIQGISFNISRCAGFADGLSHHTYGGQEIRIINEGKDVFGHGVKLADPI